MPAANFTRLMNRVPVAGDPVRLDTLCRGGLAQPDGDPPRGRPARHRDRGHALRRRLGDAKEIFYYQPGITTVSLSRVDDNNVKAKLKIAADAPLGLHDLRVRTATGISELRTFSVGALKEVSEVEPNNDFAAPQPIPMNVTVNGVADNEDVDYLRGRGQERGPDHGRGRGHAAGDHPVRPLRGDPQHASGSSWPPATMRR